MQATEAGRRDVRALPRQQADHHGAAETLRGCRRSREGDRGSQAIHNQTRQGLCGAETHKKPVRGDAQSRAPTEAQHDEAACKGKVSRDQTAGGCERDHQDEMLAKAKCEEAEDGCEEEEEEEIEEEEEEEEGQNNAKKIDMDDGKAASRIMKRPSGTTSSTKSASLALSHCRGPYMLHDMALGPTALLVDDFVP